MVTCILAILRYYGFDFSIFTCTKQLYKIYNQKIVKFDSGGVWFVNGMKLFIIGELDCNKIQIDVFCSF